jgi:hypothetical protein
MEGSGRNPIVIFMIRKNLTAATMAVMVCIFAGSNATALQARISEYAESGTDGSFKHGAKKHGCESKHFIETGDALRPSLTSWGL